MADFKKRSWALEVSPDGYITLPEEVRRDLGWSDGKKLWLEIGDTEIVLTTPEQAMERARKRAGHLFESDEAGVDALIAERRRAAAEDESSVDEPGDLAA